MTGFGKSEIERGLKRITVEIKSVNNRYFFILFSNFVPYDTRVRL